MTALLLSCLFAQPASAEGIKFVITGNLPVKLVADKDQDGLVTGVHVAPDTVAELQINPDLRLDVGTTGLQSGWKDWLAWDSVELGLLHAYDLYGVLETGVSIASGNFLGAMVLPDQMQKVMNGGPSERTITLPILRILGDAAPTKLKGTPLDEYKDMIGTALKNSPIQVPLSTTLQWDVDINHPMNLNQHATVQTLDVGTDGSLDILAGNNLTVREMVRNEGTITRSSGGSTTFNCRFENWSSQGGTVCADGGTLVFNSFLENLYGMVKSESDGSIDLNCDVDNRGGVISAGENSRVTFSGVLDGGDLKALSDGLFIAEGGTEVRNARLSGPGTFQAGSGAGDQTITWSNVVVEGAKVTMPHGKQGLRTLAISGVCRDTEVEIDGVVNATGDLSLEGSGKIVVGYGDLLSSEADATITQKAGHTIEGWWTVDANLVNHGTVKANVSGGTLEYCDRQGRNTNVLRSENGGTLKLWGTTVNEGSIEAGSTVVLATNSAIEGGDLEVESDGLFIAEGGTEVRNARLSGPGTFQAGSGAGDQTITWSNVVVEGAKVTMPHGKQGLRTLAISGVCRDTEVEIDGVVNATGDLSLEGSGKIVVGYGDLLSSEADATITQKAGHTIEGYGTVRASLINHGTVLANVDEGVLAFSDLGGANHSVLRAENGGILRLRGTTVNEGSIEAASLVELGSPAAVIEGGDLEAESGGLFVMESGSRVHNATLSGPGTFQAGSGAGDQTITWSNVVVEGAKVTMPHGKQGLRTLAISGVCRDTEVEIDGVVNATGDLSLEGSGKIVVGYGDLLSSEADATITQKAGHTIEGQGTIDANLVNYGTVKANVSGGSLLLAGGAFEHHGNGFAGDGGNLSVQTDATGSGRWEADGGTIRFGSVAVHTSGSVEARNGGRVELQGTDMTAADVAIDASSSISVASQLEVGGNVSFACQSEALWNWDQDAVLKMTGGQYDRWTFLEVGGISLGAAPENHIGSAAGYSGNFHLENLVIGTGAHVSLVDFIDNGNRVDLGWGVDEALYVRNLTLEDGAVFNLNGLDLYYTNVNGSGTLVDQPIPEPATLTLLTLGLAGLAARRKRK